ncbi:uncharacterized protein A4U43_C05F4720 [Asparagus officinalis]|uniref:Uncharacterized protein n=1 Tax=Asparagus officinalis TaxID=4686 RepID=A0A5P1EPM3_ASPOF|nr:uncharacterized protein A4U43_C05F4720 [Asparagus officinalis]
MSSVAVAGEEESKVQFSKLEFGDRRRLLDLVSAPSVAKLRLRPMPKPKVMIFTSGHSGSNQHLHDTTVQGKTSQVDLLVSLIDVIGLVNADEFPRQSTTSSEVNRVTLYIHVP